MSSHFNRRLGPQEIGSTLRWLLSDYSKSIHHNSTDLPPLRLNVKLTSKANRRCCKRRLFLTGHLKSMAAIRYYKPELDLLRFCAFLFVFFTHRMDLAPID